MTIIDDRPLPDGLSAPARRGLSAIGVSQLHTTRRRQATTGNGSTSR